MLAYLDGACVDLAGEVLRVLSGAKDLRLLMASNNEV